MSLLTPSEAVAFDGFLSAVDHPSSVEWNGFTPDLADRIPHKHGREALAKATADLMSLAGTPAPANARPSSSSSRSASVSAPSSAPPASGSHWPSFRQLSADPGAAEPPSAPFDKHRSYAFSSYPQSQSQSQSHPHLSSLGAASSSSHFASPPLATPRPGLAASASEPQAGSAAKRAFAADGASSSGAKRARPSPTSHAPPPPTRSKARRGSSSAAAKSPPLPPPSKPALLSPSQKRANHIQSEQKRRANIRRGYEALCAAVPALREAIQLEDAALASAAAAAAAGASVSAVQDVAEKGAGGKRRRRTAAKGDEEKPDGRAGPRSENVVLQKTIDYISALRDDREALLGRLSYAQGALPQGHPALQVAAEHLDERGVPLWERVWGGGTGSADDGMDDDAGDGELDGSEDEG